MDNEQNKRRNFVSRVVEATDQFMRQREVIAALLAEYDSLHIGANLEPEDFQGALEHLSINDMLLWANSAQALDLWMQEPDNNNIPQTNFLNLRP